MINLNKILEECGCEIISKLKNDKYLIQFEYEFRLSHITSKIYIYFDKEEMNFKATDDYVYSFFDYDKIDEINRKVKIEIRKYKLNLLDKYDNGKRT